MPNEIKKLFRSKNDRVIAGVAGGLGEYFGMDPVLFRILFVFLILWGGAGILFYLILVFIIPREDGQLATETIKEVAEELRGKAQDVSQQSWWTSRGHVLGVLIILAGLIFLLNQLFPMRFFKFHFIWPVIVMLIGLFVILKKT